MDKLDGIHECIDTTCRSKCHDIVDVRRGKAKIECFVCGTGQWVDAPAPAASVAGEFRLPPGARFSGLTLHEAAAEPAGLDYIRWRAEKKNCEPCKTWLAKNAATA